MDRATEIGLMEELLGLKAAKSPFLDDAVARNPVTYYTSEDRFAAEKENIFLRLPRAVAHISELSEPGDFLRKDVSGKPILLTRDKAGEIRAFLNVCRHRGTRLVDDEKGCRHRFSCPYHAWTYASSGELIAAPHFDTGFPDTDKSQLNLTTVNSAVLFGFVWIWFSDLDFESYFEAMSEDLDWLEIDKLVIAAEDTHTHRANWKILVEGGIEAYHFKVAHRSTIGPYFEDNLSSYQTFGQHMRSVLPRASMAEMVDRPRDEWHIRDHANLLYTLFPTSQLLVQQDHIVWITSEPLSPGETQLRISTLAPASAEEDKSHWLRNHKITTMTLDEDFAIGESIQSVASSGANSDMIFGRFEGALDVFNRTVDSHIT